MLIGTVKKENETLRNAGRSGISSVKLIIKCGS